MEQKLTTCPFCKSLLEDSQQRFNPRGQFFFVDCPVCTKFNIEEAFLGSGGHLEKYFGPRGSSRRKNASRWLSGEPETTDLRTEKNLKRLAALANEVDEEAG